MPPGGWDSHRFYAPPVRYTLRELPSGKNIRRKIVERPKNSNHLDGNSWLLSLRSCHDGHWKNFALPGLHVYVKGRAKRDAFTFGTATGDKVTKKPVAYLVNMGRQHFSNDEYHGTRLNRGSTRRAL